VDGKMWMLVITFEGLTRIRRLVEIGLKVKK
jgi:hypothetical protein